MAAKDTTAQPPATPAPTTPETPTPKRDKKALWAEVREQFSADEVKKAAASTALEVRLAPLRKNLAGRIHMTVDEPLAVEAVLNKPINLADLHRDILDACEDAYEAENWNELLLLLFAQWKVVRIGRS